MSTNTLTDDLPSIVGSAITVEDCPVCDLTDARACPACNSTGTIVFDRSLPDAGPAASF